MKKFFWLMLTILLIPYLQFILRAAPVVAETFVSSQQLLSTNQLSASIKSKTIDDKVDWIINYNKSETKQPQQLKVQVLINGLPLTVNELVEGSQVDWKDSTDKKAQNWLSWSNATSTQKTGTLEFTTIANVTSLAVGFQVDEIAGNKLNENCLSLADSQLKQVDLTKGQTSINALSDSSSDTTVASSDITNITSTQNSQNTKVTSSTTQTSDSSTTSGTPPKIKLNEIEGSYAGYQTPEPRSLQSATDISVRDPFDYTKGEMGIYPTNQTHNYSSNENSENLENFDFSQQDNQRVPTRSVINQKNNFEMDYHTYNDGAIKKIVMPTSDPSRFKVQLDIIGKALKKSNPIDIALVLDKSSSMNFDLAGNKASTTQNSLWKVLQSAVGDFTNQLLNSDNDGAIRLGLADFGSKSEYSGRVVAQYSDGTPATQYENQTVYADIGKFKNGSAFTDQASQVMNHSIVSNAPGENSGTPTFMGLDGGYKLLTDTKYGARANAEKVLIVLTDGLPTYAPNSSYYNKGLDTTGIVRSSSRSNDKDTYSSSIKYEMKDDGRQYTGYGPINNYTEELWTGDGTETQTNINSVVNANGDYAQARSRQAKTVKTYSIGFTTKENAKNVLRAIGSNGNFSASNQNELIDALNQLKTSLSDSIKDGAVLDPMSPYVTYQKDAKISGLKIKSDQIQVVAQQDVDYAQVVQSDFSEQDNELGLSNLNLGGDSSEREGVRLTYTVELKPQYRDGKFYPANGTTYLVNQSGTTLSTDYFAVPSIRNVPLPYDLALKKTDGQGQALSGAKFTLSDGDLKSAVEVTSEKNGAIRFDGAQLHENESYRLTETSPPNGYQLDSAGPWTIKIVAGSVTVEDRQGQIQSLNVTKQADVNEAGPLLADKSGDYTIVNKKVPTFGLKINKMDLEKKQGDSYQKITGTALKHAEFTAVSVSKNAQQGYYTETGKDVYGDVSDGQDVRFTNLTWVTGEFAYVIQENTAPTGYQCDDKDGVLIYYDQGQKAWQIIAAQKDKLGNWQKVTNGILRTQSVSYPVTYDSDYQMQSSGDQLDVPVPLKIQWEESRHSATSTDEGTLQFNLLNEPNEPVLLPHTGGIGRSLFISCGLITIIIVGIYFHRKKEVA